MSAPRFVDTHCHLDQPHFAEDRAAVIERAVRAGVSRLITLGVDEASSREAIDLAAEHEAVYATVGWHPHEAATFGAAAEAVLADLAAQPKVVAIGEIGLDFFRDYAPRDVQVAALRRQLDLAVDLDLPVCIHDRAAHAEILAELRAWAGRHIRRPDPAGVMHCFSGDLALAQACLALGFVISLAGPLTYPKAHQLSEVARQIPLESLVVETDAPYLPPQDRRGERNEPVGVLAVARRLAELRGLPLAEVADRTNATARRLFRLPD